MVKKTKSQMGSGQIIMTAIFAFFFFSALDVGRIACAKESEEAFPSKSIRFIVPAAAGGSLGNEIRMITPYLEKHLKVKTTVEYVVGADGMIAYNKFPREKPDGYTLLYFNLNSAMAIELTREGAEFKVGDFTPIASWNVKRHALVVHIEKWKTFAEFLKDAKTRSISMTLTGGSATLQGYLMETALGIKFNFVPYASAGESLAAIAGTHVEGGIQFDYPPKPLIRAGKIRALSVFSLTPDPILPGVPNMKELGYSDFPCLAAYGTFAAPPNTPKGIVPALEKAIREAVTVPELNKVALDSGVAVDFTSTSELQTLVKEHYELLNKYKQFIK